MAIRASRSALTSFLVLIGALFLSAWPACADPNTVAANKFALALRYEHAEGVPRDYPHALELYCVAACLGHADAAFNIAWMFLNGRGVPHNAAAGAAWLRVAAERGQAQARILLDHLGEQPLVQPIGCRPPEPEPPVIVPPAEIAALVHKTAATYKIDPKLVLAVIATESGFVQNAVSSKNAQGLMQLMPETAHRFGVKNAFDPAENIRGGTKYLRWLLAFFEGDLSLALAGYNAGENAVIRHGGIPPYPETEAYLAKIRRLYPAQQHPFDRLALLR